MVPGNYVLQEMSLAVLLGGLLLTKQTCSFGEQLCMGAALGAGPWSTALGP